MGSSGSSRWISRSTCPSWFCQYSTAMGSLAFLCASGYLNEERRGIAEGADIVVTELTFGADFTPLDMKVCMPNEGPYTTEG